MTIIHAVGDVAPRRADPASIFAGVTPRLADADLVFGQLECPLSDRGEPSPNAKLAMRTAPSVAPLLQDAGFDVMSIAGNHALDFGKVALADTLKALDHVGIARCGAGGGIAEARAPAIVDAGGQRIAFLSYTSILPAGYAAEVNRAGCAPMRAYTHYHQVEPDQPGTPPRVVTFADRADLAALVADIRAARAQAQQVALSIHWGIHFVRAEIADYQREVAYAAIEAGADMILGHHPHVLKGVEIYQGKPIFYSLGNFAIEQPSAFKEDVHRDASFADISRLGGTWAPGEKYMAPPETRHTLIARLAVDEKSVGVTILPCRIDDDSVPQLLAPGTAEWDEMLAYLRAITQEAGIETLYEERGDGVAVVVT